MASSVPGYTNPQTTPVRLPRLSYRTKSCDTESVSSASTDFTRSAASTTPTSPLQSTFCPSPRAPPSEMSLPSSPRQSSFSPSTKASSTIAKKRPNFLSGLFGPKEPSAQALQDYQRQLMKQGGGRITAVGMPGVSSAKLPATVPKVNSRWDGLPQTMKEREKYNDAARQSMSGLNRQFGSSRSGRSERRATSTGDPSRKRLSRCTLSGASMQSGSSNNLAGLYGWETNSSHSGNSVINFAAEHRPTMSRSAPPLQHNPPFHPHSPSLPALPSPPTSLSPPSRFGSPNPPDLSYSPMLTPDEPSPATPDAAPPIISLMSPKSEMSPSELTKITLLEVPGSGDEVLVKSAGVNILGPPAAAKRKSKPSPLQPSEERPKTSETEFQPSSIIRREAPVGKKTPSPRPALASYFPNTLITPNSDSSAKVSARRGTSRDRQGLGKSTMNQIAPWLSPDQAIGPNDEGERVITPTPEGGTSLKRKSRMTLFKK